MGDLGEHANTEFSNGVTLHHIGFVVQSIAQTGESFARSIGSAWNREIIHDPLQMVRVTFFQPPTPQQPVIELVEPADEKSPVTSFLKKGGGLHHVCYEVDDLQRQLEWSRSNRDLIVRPPLPAVAFGGRRIAWIFTRTKLLVEYLERKPA